MVSTGVVVLVAVIALVVGLLAGQWVADLRRARQDAARVMRTRSNYRRSRSSQK